MSDPLFDSFLAARANPDDPRAVDAFLVQAHLFLSRTFVRSDDPDEMRQRALLRVHRSWPRCLAESPGRLRAWLRTIVRRVARSADRGRRSEPLPDVIVDPTPGPEARALDHARGRAFEQAVTDALALHPDHLPGPLRVIGRRLRIGKDHATVSRNVEIAIEVRRDGRPVVDVAHLRGMTVDAVKQAVVRGAAAIAVAAAAAAGTEEDPLLREAKEKIAHLGLPGP
jgi:hypothetical protein